MDCISGGPNTYEGTESSPLAVWSVPCYLFICLFASISPTGQRLP